MSLTKQLRTRFHRVPLIGYKKSAPVDFISPQYQRNWATVSAIWPDGTWTLPWGSADNKAVMDDVIRAELLDLWTYEELKVTGKFFGMKLDGAKFTSNPIPEDWKPSEKRYRKFALSNNHAAPVVNHVVSRLSQLGKLQA